MPIALPHSLLKNLPLRCVLTVPFVLLTLGTTALVGYLSYQSGHKAVEDLGHQLVTHTNERVTQELKSYLQMPLLVNRLNVDAVNQGQLDLQNTPALEAALFNRSQQFDQMTAILFVNPQGKFRLVERVPDLYAVEADPPRPDKMRIYPLDSNGRRKKLIPAKNPLDVRDRSWYKRAIATGKPGWDSISQYGGFEALSLTTSQPVYDRATNRLLGVFAVHLRLDYLSQFLNQLDISRAGQVIIMDQNGDLIATSTQEKLYTLTGGAGAWRQFKPLQIDQSQNALTRSLGQYLRARSLDQSQSLEFRYNSELHYVKATPFRDQYGLDWRILTVIPKSHFMGAIERNTDVTVVFCVLALGAALLIGVLAANKLSACFVELSRASRNLAAGNLNQRLPMHSIAELNALAQTFNQMAGQLQHAFERLKTDLTESEEKFAVIFHSSPDPITLVLMAEGRCVEANESFLNLLEYSREALIGQPLLDLGAWENLEECAHFRQVLQAQNHVCNLEAQFVTRTKQVKTVLISAELIEINDEIYSLSMVRDISDRKQIEDGRKQAEAALQASETRFRQLAETVREGFFVFETEADYYSYVNPAYAEIRGEPFRLFYKGMSHWLNRVHPDDRDRIEAALERERQGENFSEEYRFVRPDGEVRWLRSKAFPLQNEAGAVVRVVGTVEDITVAKQREAEREATQQALEQAEERYSLATRAAKVGVWEWNIQKATIYLDPNIKALIGYSDDEIRNDVDDWMSFVHPDDRAEVTNAAQAYLAGETPEYIVEYRMLHKDGSIIWILMRGQLIRDEQGKPERLIGTDTDITDRIRSEIALQASEARFQEIAQTINQVFYVVDLTTGQYLYISPAYERVWGYSCESLYQNPKSWLDRIHPEDSEYVLWGFNQLLSGNQIQLEYRMIDAKGEIHWIKSESLVVRDEDGNPLRMVGLADDITDRKQLEEALRASEERFRRAFDNAPIGIALVSIEGRFLRVNRSICDILKFSETELLARSLQDITDADNAQVGVSGIQQLLAGDIAIFQAEERYLQKQGSTVQGSLSVSLVKDHENQPLYFIAQVQDISDRYQVEQMKDEFVSIVSHELRTPLTSIRGALGILKSGVFHDRPEKAEHMLQVALHNSDRLVRLVNDILSLERLKSGKVPLVMEHCQVTDLMQQAVNSVQTLAEQSEIDLCLTPVSASLRASPDAVVQALINLLSNAIKFSTAGGTVWFNAEAIEEREMSDHQMPTDSPIPSILFMIRDQGRGIPQDKLDVIFEQFQQVDLSDSRDKAGTGLGLAICKQIVQQHHGQIWVKSCAGEGSTFYFALPFSSEDRVI